MLSCSFVIVIDVISGHCIHSFWGMICSFIGFLGCFLRGSVCRWAKDIFAIAWLMLLTIGLGMFCNCLTACWRAWSICVEALAISCWQSADNDNRWSRRGSSGGNEINLGSFLRFSITVHRAKYGAPVIIFIRLVRSAQASLSSRSGFDSIGVALVLWSDVGADGSKSVLSRKILGSSRPTWL